MTKIAGSKNLPNRFIKPHKDGVTFSLHLQPSAGSDRILEIRITAEGEAVLRAQVTAAPEKGKANDALIKMLAKAWGFAKSDLSILTGRSGRRKVILIKGDRKEVIATLQDQLSPIRSS